MPTLHLLGTGAALSDPTRTTTMLAVEGPTVIVIDCGGDVVQRLLAAGIDLDRIELLILSHEHPDHVAGFPLFMEKIWLADRRRPIAVRGPADALEQARRLFDAFDTTGWDGLPEIDWGEVAMDEGAEVWRDDHWSVTASPGRHSVPVIGVRIASGDGRVVTYSADTEPTEPIRRLAAGSTILVHEATGDFPGHSQAAGAARLARDADVESLVLVHLAPDFDQDALASARKVFAETRAGTDGSRIEF